MFYAKASPVTAHSAVAATATSNPVDCTNYNSILLHAVVTGTGTWTLSFTASTTKDGTYVPLAGGSVALSKQITASGAYTFKGMPDWVKIVATEDVNGSTLSVIAQPINL